MYTARALVKQELAQHLVGRFDESISTTTDVLCETPDVPHFNHNI